MVSESVIHLSLLLQTDGGLGSLIDVLPLKKKKRFLGKKLYTVLYLKIFLLLLSLLYLKDSLDMCVCMCACACNRTIFMEIVYTFEYVC